MDHEPILDEEYLRAIEYVESLPENQSGADKSWVHRMQSAPQEYCRRTTRRVDPNASIARTLADHHREALKDLLDGKQHEPS
jgi:hypothetical protein